MSWGSHAVERFSELEGRRHIRPSASSSMQNGMPGHGIARNRELRNDRLLTAWQNCYVPLSREACQVRRQQNISGREVRFAGGTVARTVREANDSQARKEESPLYLYG